MRSRLCSPAGMLHEDLTVCKMREFLDLGGGGVVGFFWSLPLEVTSAKQRPSNIADFHLLFCSFHDATGPVSFSGNCSTAGVFTARTPTCGQTPECSSSIKFLHLSLSFPFSPPPNKPHPGRLCKKPLLHHIKSTLLQKKASSCVAKKKQ